MLIPFVLMLATIAVAPLIVEKFWESNRNKLIVTLVLAIPTAIFLVLFGLGHALEHQILGDYIPFIILLLALFVVTGGIQIKGDITATPIVNACILGLGYVLASFMGTTGAAMLLIRPLLQINHQRKRVTHTVLFFIAMVANCGGVLTPLGDPPLFLLYLRGAPFEWFSSLFAEWAFVGIALTAIYVIWDKIEYRKEPLSAKKEDLEQYAPIRVKGRINFAWLLGIIASVIFLNEHYIPAMAQPDCPVYIKFIREIVLTVIIILSLVTTSEKVRKGNNFSWAPILEVAILFVGIFTTMTPALLFLNQNAGSLGLSEGWQFFYSTGALSAFLDNSPTAVAFHSVASGLDAGALTACSHEVVAGIPEDLLKAISLGAVFFGSMTYIGNGPNFMVKSIAEQEGIKMPSFFGYMIRFSLIVVLPVLVITQLLFI